MSELTKGYLATLVVVIALIVYSEFGGKKK